MYRKAILIHVFAFMGLISILYAGGNETKETQVQIVTTEGIIKIKLYNDTPLHRDNFVKLVNSHFYDSTIFHRVINQFMIQGGDPDSKKAAPGVMLGNGSTGYTIPAEIMPDKHYHKKGALAAARMGDDVNPNKESSGCQFYIVQGRNFNVEDLNSMEQRMLNNQKQEAFSRLMNKPENANLRTKFTAFQQSQQTDSLMAISKLIEPMVLAEVTKMPQFKFSEEQRKIYSTVGGTPHLDGGYTVFGEVVEGLDLVDKIAAAKTLPGDRPEKDIRILKMSIEK
ncbi:MAG: peptidylprolyl isomerase [Bacteroidetes bacterium]|nr:peptidylprolyl isomerase [Bacteroidota bacterium]